MNRVGSQQGLSRRAGPWLWFCAVGCGWDEDHTECIEASQEVISDGVSELVASYESCANRYAEWTRELESAAGTADVRDVLEDARLYELAGLTQANGVSSALTVAVNQLDAAGRRSVFDDSTRALAIPAERCREARSDFASSLAEQRSRCEAFFDWEDSHRRDWEGYEDARSQFVESCGPLCPGIFVSYGYQLVPRPTRTASAAHCV
jgi:hypothetical protein